ncbi:hypothetical protein PoB_007578900 [Plakobranchus ocellatus]|uniref:Uncharacterized protein n=1 Tax=Plakobranchus ocellatus TaxID=259542 RepID=A0AAV4DYJ8_9GAST|nr:hypothetical protein PoB_007578900 [Plakobranchus ocellatus]
MPEKTSERLRKGVGENKNREDPAVFFLAELEDQMEISKKDGATRPAMKSIPLLTPEEVLACHYLRLNQDQVAFLEDAIRKKGADPGIHVHMDVTNYDVFSEIRRLRNSQTPRARFQEVREEIDEAEEPGSHKSSLALVYPPTNSATTSGKKGGVKKG